MPNDFQTAQWYDALYANVANYAQTADMIESVTNPANTSGRLSLLDVACGTGRLLEELLAREHFDVQGLDLDSRMLAIARVRLPDVTFHEADMTDFDLDQRFDVITCLGSSLPAVATRERLDTSIYRFARHLKPSGVLIVEGFIEPDDWEAGRLSANFVDQPELKIARMVRSSRRDDTAVMDMHYLISTPSDVRQFVEHHELGLFTDDDYADAFRNAGLHIERGADGLLNRKTFIGRHKIA